MTQRAANRYDALKCVALIAMTLDHVVFFLLPEENWLRLFGRIAAPIFLLLVGYNHSYRFRASLLLLACVVSIADGVLVALWLPQNILWTILIVRILMQSMPLQRFHEMAALSVLAIPFTMPFLDFGSFGLLFALIGHRLREKRDAAAAFWMAVGTGLFYLYSCHIVLENPGIPVQVGLAALLAMTAIGLWRVDYLAPIRVMPRLVSAFAGVALYYYAAHKIVLEALTLL